MDVTTVGSEWQYVDVMYVGKYILNGDVSFAVTGMFGMGAGMYLHYVEHYS